MPEIIITIAPDGSTNAGRDLHVDEEVGEGRQRAAGTGPAADGTRLMQQQDASGPAGDHARLHLSLIMLPRIEYHARSGQPFEEVREMFSLEEVQRINRELGERINDETLKDPNSPYAGKFVGIANGQVVVVTDDGESLYYRLQEIEPDHRRVFCVEASRDYTRVERV